MTTVKIKQNDTKGIFTDVLTIDGEPVNLSGCTVRFLFRKPGRLITQDAMIMGTFGEVGYQPTPDDVSEVGKYQQEWEVTFLNGGILTFPNDGYNTVIIGDDIG